MPKQPSLFPLPEKDIFVTNSSNGPGYYEVPKFGRWINIRTRTALLNPPLKQYVTGQGFNIPENLVRRIHFTLPIDEHEQPIDAYSFIFLHEPTEALVTVGWITYQDILSVARLRRVQNKPVYLLPIAVLRNIAEITKVSLFIRHRGPLSRHEEYYAKNPPNFIINEEKEEQNDPSGLIRKRVGIRLLNQAEKILRGLPPGIDPKLFTPEISR